MLLECFFFVFFECFLPLLLRFTSFGRSLRVFRVIPRFDFSPVALSISHNITYASGFTCRLTRVFMCSLMSSIHVISVFPIINLTQKIKLIIFSHYYQLAANMTHYILTRFLYSQDEVTLSLVTSLLKRDNLQESYYWAYELYYSGVDMTSLFWKIHFDFYAERNPKLEGYMKLRMNALQEDKDMKHIAYIVRNMFRLKPASTTFILRQFLASGGVTSCVYRGRRPAWLNEYEKPYRNLMLSIKKGPHPQCCLPS